MNYLKMLGLAAIAAMVIAAFAGAGTASAAVLCKTAPNKSGVCEGGKYASGTTFEGTASNATLTVAGSSALTQVVCTHSLLQFYNSAEAGSPGVPGAVSDLTFTGCKANDFFSTSCTVSTTSGYNAELEPFGFKGNGSLILTGNAETEVVCGSIFKCKYKPRLLGWRLSFTGGNPAEFTAFVEEFQQVIGSEWTCGTGASWDGTYKLVGFNTALWTATS